MDSTIQDWTTIVIKKPVKKETLTLPRIENSPSGIKVTQDENGDEVLKLKTVSHDMAQFIIKARVEKGLKQTDLAKRACLDAKTLADIERGGCIYNAGNVNKIAKALGVNIPRK